MKKLLKLVFVVFLIFLGTLFLADLLLGEKDFCLDTGCCKEGLVLNTEKGKIVVNEITCKENNGTWDSKHRRCQF